MGRATHTFWSELGDYSVGLATPDQGSLFFPRGGHFLAIGMQNTWVEYSEYYVISEAQFELFSADEAAGRAFADACRDQRHDHMLMLGPAPDRGYPVIRRPNG